MTGHRSSPNQDPKARGRVCPEDKSLPAEGCFGSGKSEDACSRYAASQGEQPVALLRETVTRQATSRFGEQCRPILPLLSHLVPDAVGGAIFFYDPAKRQLCPEAVVNLSPDFITALAYAGERLMTAAAEQAQPYLVVDLSGSKRFRSLWKLADGEGIRTLWLVPWPGQDASMLGAFLFASRKTFLPSKEDLASVALLTAWTSAVLRQVSGEKENEGFRAELEGGGEDGMRIENDHRIAAMDDLMRGLIRSWQDQTAEWPDGQIPHPLIGIGDAGTTALPMYEDKHGIPVIYDAYMHEQRKRVEPDAASVLSHELLSPLTLIKGYTATLLQLSEVITEEQRGRYLRGIESAINKVIQLIENLRDIARLEEADTVTLQSTSLLDLLRQTVSEVQSQTTKHVIKLRPLAPLPLVKLDQQKIAQVMTNLLVNAVKYSPHEGDIETSVRLVRDEYELKEIFAEAPPMRLPSLIVSIADSGIGIPEAELGRIFERFYRADNRLTHATAGAGLGLYICKIIVESHGGRIWARNRFQGGSIFSFSLPVDQ